MNKVVRNAFLKSLGLNMLAGVIGLLPFIFLTSEHSITWGIILIIIAALSLLTQLIISLVYINIPEKKEIGQGMLISVGIFLLIGLSVCGPIWF